MLPAGVACRCAYPWPYPVSVRQCAIYSRSTPLLDIASRAQLHMGYTDEPHTYNLVVICVRLCVPAAQFLQGLGDAAPDFGGEAKPQKTISCPCPAVARPKV